MCLAPNRSPTCLPVLLHAVAAVVELGEGGGQLVEVVAQRVQQQVIQDLLQDLRESQDALPKLPLAYSFLLLLDISGHIFFFIFFIF